MIGEYALAIALGYLAGSVPFGYLLARRAGGLDVRRAGSGSTGATNVLRFAGAAPAALTLVLDLAKGAAVTLVARWLGGGRPGLAVAAGLASVVGHVASPWIGLRGGKGAATAAGALAPVAPVAVVASLAIFAAGVVATRRVSVGSLAGAAAFPAWAALLGSSRTIVAGGIVVAAILAWSHRDNLVRLATGREPRLGEGHGEAGGRGA